MAFNSPHAVTTTPEKALEDFPDPKQALGHFYKSKVLIAELQCSTLLRLTPDDARLSKEHFEEYGTLHYNLLEQYALLAKLCQLPGFDDKDAFTRNGFHNDMWDHAIMDFVSKLDLDDAEMGHFTRSYLDKCKALMVALKADIPRQTFVWDFIIEQIDLHPPVQFCQ